MQKKIAIMLILVMMAELDAHRVLDSHGVLGKNFRYKKWFKSTIKQTQILIYWSDYLLIWVLDEHWTLVRGPQGIYYSPWRDNYPNIKPFPTISRTFKDTNTKERSYLDTHNELEDDLSRIPEDSNHSGNASKNRRFCVFSNKPGCIHLRIY